MKIFFADFASIWLLIHSLWWFLKNLVNNSNWILSWLLSSIILFLMLWGILQVLSQVEVPKMIWIYHAPNTRRFCTTCFCTFPWKHQHLSTSLRKFLKRIHFINWSVMCVIAKMSSCSHLIWFQVKEVLKSIYEPLFYRMLNWYQIHIEVSPSSRVGISMNSWDSFTTVL